MAFRIDPRPRASVEEAQAHSTFPLRMPAIPPAFELEFIRQYWPNHLSDEEHLSIHADWVEARYTDPSGDWIEVVQGFVGKWLSLYPRAPETSKGDVVIDGVHARWIRGRPTGKFVQIDGKRVDDDWLHDVVTVGWEEEIHGDSHRYYMLTSSSLTVESLVEVARTLPPGG